MPASSADLAKALEEILEELEGFEATDQVRILQAVAALVGLKLS